MINKLPFIGWFLSFAANVSLSIPFWLCWTVCEIGKTYFDFLPLKYQSIPFWSCVGLFMVIGILKGTFAISFVNVNQKVEKA
jgi:hypothetical protein